MTGNGGMFCPSNVCIKNSSNKCHETTRHLPRTIVGALGAMRVLLQDGAGLVGWRTLFDARRYRAFCLRCAYVRVVVLLFSAL